MRALGRPMLRWVSLGLFLCILLLGMVPSTFANSGAAFEIGARNQAQPAPQPTATPGVGVVPLIAPANLDQCANDPKPSPNTNGCSQDASSWVNGNLGASKANYFE